MDTLSRALAQEAMAKAPTVVVKVGSALLVDDDGSIRREWMSALVDDLPGWSKPGGGWCWSPRARSGSACACRTGIR